MKYFDRPSNIKLLWLPMQSRWAKCFTFLSGIFLSSSAGFGMVVVLVAVFILQNNLYFFTRASVVGVLVWFIYWMVRNRTTLQKRIGWRYFLAGTLVFFLIVLVFSWRYMLMLFFIGFSPEDTSAGLFVAGYVAALYGFVGLGVGQTLLWIAFRIEGTYKSHAQVTAEN